uniref:Putative ovule protein n=1 Tax=Solanum chacoense TaxID=4108 RepID=A0A0V0GTY3_SOLCH
MLRCNKIGTENLGSIWGVSVFEMNDFKFISKFPSKEEAQRVRMDKWCWKILALNLQWWLLKTGCFSKKHLDRNWYGSDY